MHLSLATAVSIALAAGLFAGCSTTQQGSSALPGSSSVGQSHHVGSMGFKGGVPQYPKGPMTRERMLKWFIAGKMLGTTSRENMVRDLKALEAAKGRSHPAFHPDKAAVRIWTNNPYEDEIIGTDNIGKGVVGTSITTTANGCYAGMGIKVDHNKNIWESCSETTVGSSLMTIGGVSEYDKSGNPLALYNGGCPTNIPVSQCANFSGYGLDVATTQSTVFVSDEYMEAQYTCNGSQCGSNPNCTYQPYHYDWACYAIYSGFEYWPSGSPTTQPTMIDLTTLIPGSTVYNTSYFDVDSAGNIWTYAYGATGSVSGTGIVEITNPTTSPVATVAVPFGSMSGQYYWGMSYVSNHGAVLNVTDPFAASTYQYNLSPSFTGTPFNTLGPVGSEPLLGGFNKYDTRLVQADVTYSGQLDFVMVSTNTGTTATNAHLYYPQGAAYARSDK